MVKKILSILCIGVIYLSILNPIQIKAYSTELDTEVNGNLTEEQIEDAIGSSIISYLLATGCDLIVPGSGQTVASIYEEINDVLGEALDIKNNLIGWFQDLQIRYENPELLLPWNWDKSMMLQGTPLSNAADYYLQHRTNDTHIESEPDVNYLPYIELINGSSNNYQYQQADFFFDDAYDYLNSGSIKLQDDCKNHSFVKYDNYPTIDKFNASSQTNYYISYFASNKYQTRTMCATTTILDVTINGSGDNFSFLIQPNNIFPLWKYNTQDRYSGSINYNTTNSVWGIAVGSLNSAPTLSSFGYTGTLEDCFKMLSMYCRNVNIFVNGDPWAIVSPDPDPIQIGGNTYLTGTNIPVEYKFPEGTLNDLALIKSILHQLIDLNNTGNSVSIKIDDILEAFTDENGQQAMYVIVVHRNDYDQLIIEQYPYKVVPGENNLALSRDSILETYNNQAKYIVKDMGTDAIPNDILRIIGAAGALLLVAYLINRMLE